MDPTTPAAPNTTPAAPIVAPSIPTPQQISGGHPEHGSSHVVATQETPGDTEDQVQPAKQETGTPVIVQPTEAIPSVEVAPSIPEVAVEKSVENIVEKAPDLEKPELPQVVKDAGVTLSGPGIPVDENSFAVKKMPMTFEQAEAIEKTTKIKESKHWLAELIIYMWRKLNPMLGKKGQKT
jgi:hypothetical protein